MSISSFIYLIITQVQNRTNPIFLSNLLYYILYHNVPNWLTGSRWNGSRMHLACWSPATPGDVKMAPSRFIPKKLDDVVEDDKDVDDDDVDVDVDLWFDRIVTSFNTVRTELVVIFDRVRIGADNWAGMLEFLAKVDTGMTREVEDGLLWCRGKSKRMRVVAIIK